MARFPFRRLEDTEIRKPSKVRLVFLIFLLLLILSGIFILLYFKVFKVNKEKAKPTNSPSEKCSSPACISAAGMFGAAFIIALFWDKIELQTK